MSRAADIELADTALYRLYTEGGDLLYIGIAVDPGRRYTQHRAGKPWGRDIASMDVAWFPYRGLAVDAERDAIQTEHPRYNIIHNGKPADVIEVPVETEVVEQIRGVCAGCGWVIPPRWGYLVADIARAYRARDARARGLEGIRLDPTVAEDWDPAPWVAWCNDCQLDPEGNVDVIELHTLTTWRALSWVTAEVMVKYWGPHSNWLGMTSRLSIDGNGGCLQTFPSLAEADKAQAESMPTAYRADVQEWYPNDAGSDGPAVIEGDAYDNGAYDGTAGYDEAPF